MIMTDFKDKYKKELAENSFRWCKYCKWYVSKSSKHCRACNRCTSNFDHHCKWLNNCVTKQNYPSFFILICVTLTLLLYEITLGILMVTNKIDASNHLFINFESMTFIYTLIALQTFVAIFFAIPLAQLILFHIYLCKEGITTYEWVVLNEKIAKQTQNKEGSKNTTPYSSLNDEEQEEEEQEECSDDSHDYDEKQSQSISQSNRIPAVNNQVNVYYMFSFSRTSH